MPSSVKKQIKDSREMQKLVHKRKSARKRLIILLSILFLEICFAFVFYMNISKIQIYSIDVSGNQIIDTDVVVTDVQKILSGKYLGLIPKTNIFFYPKNKLIAQIKKDFPRFSSVKVELKDKINILISVEEEKGVALWCGMDTLVPDIIDMKSDCSFTDTDGKIIDSAPYYSGNAYFRFFGAGIGFDQNNPLDQTFVEKEKFHSLLDFGNNVASLGFPIKAVLLEGDNEDAFILDLGDGRYSVLSFNDNDNYGTLYNNLVSAFNKKEFKDEIMKNKDNLSYLDMRFKNKIYYKFKDSSGSGDANNSTTTIQ